MNDRLKALRKSLGLNQTEFGARLGVTPTAISILESGKRNITDQMLLAVCREFGVNEDWLRNGSGEMFREAGAAEMLAAEYGLDEFAIRTLKAYQQLTPANRAVIKDFMMKICVEASGETAPESAAPPLPQAPLTIAEQAALLRARADALEKGEQSSTITEKPA